MSRQDKATSERHTRTLRDLVKRPENKVCADCKRNDPRWASWNLGVFLCIRCSGIHRGMGTHISKIKSVDLDIWTPEQMDSIQKWGNGRANLYWEGHLKPGHIPAEHKMESFIRSKYESRRWALEGPPPRDPSILENAREDYPESAPPPPPPPPPTQQTSTRTSQATAPPQRQPHALLSSQSQPKSRVQPPIQPRASAAVPPNVPTPSPAPAPPQDDLFNLDFHAPASSTSVSSTPGVQKKDVKNDILSLFASTPSPGTGVMGGGGFGAAQQQGPTQPTNMVGNGPGIWGAPSGWNGMQSAQPNQPTGVWGQQQQPGQTPQNNVWGQPQQQQQPPQFGAFTSSTQAQNSGGTHSWGVSSAVPSTGNTGMDLFASPFSNTVTSQTAKKDDAFGDLWGGFK